MTKKHFEAFARHIRFDYLNPDVDGIDRRTAEYAARLIISVAVQENPRFDTGRFLRACGLILESPTRMG